MIEAAQARCPDLRACSFDRGFHSPANRLRLDQLLEHNVLPRKGRLNRGDRVREEDPAFVAARRQHPAVESAIHNLEHRGLDRMRAYGADGFARVVALGLLYDDDRLNALFVCRNASGQPAGAEILGIAPRADRKPFRGMASGSRKARSGFWLPCDRSPPVPIILTESAVDAISARSLSIVGTRENGAAVVSTAGVVSAVPPWIEGRKPKKIVCAYDADSAGNAAAGRLVANDPRVIKMRPASAKDWNDMRRRR